MSDELKPGDPAPWPFPSFIKCAAAINPLSGTPFDCWVPDRTGNREADYEAGKRHFAAALACARTLNSPWLLVNVYTAILHVKTGPIELGFIDALASKATCGAPGPSIITPRMLQIAIEGGLRATEEGTRAVEEEVTSLLRTARALRSPETVAKLLIDTIVARGPPAPYVGAYVIAICVAALNGGGN